MNKWKPILSAPLDRNLWLWDGQTRWIGRYKTSWDDTGFWAANAYEKGDYFVSCSHQIRPTHWMELPEPPK